MESFVNDTANLFQGISFVFNNPIFVHDFGVNGTGFFDSLQPENPKDFQMIKLEYENMTEQLYSEKMNYYKIQNIDIVIVGSPEIMLLPRFSLLIIPQGVHYYFLAKVDVDEGLFARIGPAQEYIPIEMYPKDDSIPKKYSLITRH